MKLNIQRSNCSRSAIFLAAVLSVGTATIPRLGAQPRTDEILLAQNRAPSNEGMDPATEAQARRTLEKSMAGSSGAGAAPPAPAASPESPASQWPSRGNVFKGTNGPDPWAFPPPKFESWPSPPPAKEPLPPGFSGPKPPERSPLDPARGKKLYSFRAENLELKLALAMFARANKLNIVPDQDVTGQVTLDVEDLPLDQMMRALIEAHDFTWSDEAGLIRVRAEETRMFSINYLRLSRKGMGISSASLSSGGSGGGSGGGGGSGAGGGGMGGGGGGSVGGSAVNLTADNSVDFWKEVKEELAKLLTAKGKESLAINPTAGLIQVTDRPSALKRMQTYIEQVGTTVQRQVDIEAQLFDVALGDQFAFGIDWVQLGYAAGGTFAAAGTPYAAAPGGAPIITPGGEFKNVPGALTMIFTNKNTKAAITALQTQGDVQVISQPRLRTLNNQTALIKVGTDTPFFSRNVYYTPYYYTPADGGGANGGANNTIVQDTYQLITVGTILALTPQVGEDGTIAMDISPVITNLKGIVTSPDGTTTAPELEIKQASALVRVRSGETIVMGGLIQDSAAKAVRKIPIVGDIPLLGYLFQGRSNARYKRELVIFLTPTIVR